MEEKRVIAESKSEHKTVITENRNDTGNGNGNEKMRTKETVVAVLKHVS